MSNEQSSMQLNVTNTTTKSFEERYFELLSPESIGSAIKFTVDRLPNIREFIYTTVPNAFLQTLLSPITNKFDGSHPTELIAFRDITKLLPLLAATNAGIEIGHTGIKYDNAALIGTTRKAVYKGGFLILVGSIGLDTSTMTTLALTANFASEPFARFPKITSREYQTNCKNCNISYLEYQQTHYSYIIGRTFTESASKTFTSDILVGYTLQPFFRFTGNYINKASDYTLKFICNSLTSANIVNFGRARGPYEKAAICIAQGNVAGLFAKVGIKMLYFAIEWPAKTLSEFSKSILFVPIVSAVSDGPAADWLFGSSIEYGNTLIGAIVAKTCYTTLPMPYCFIAGALTKLGLSEAYQSGSETLAEAIGYTLGSNSKTAVTVTSAFILSYCIQLNHPVKYACIALAPTLLVLNSYDIAESPIIEWARNTAISAFDVAADTTHEFIEKPVYQAYSTVYSWLTDNNLDGTIQADTAGQTHHQSIEQ
jgi:hypothetical protein